MNKEMIDLIFSHIQGLGAEGAELFKLYLGLYYGYNLICGIMVLSGIYLIVRHIRSICMDQTFHIDQCKRVHRLYFGTEYNPSCGWDRKELDTVISKELSKKQ